MIETLDDNLVVPLRKASRKYSGICTEYKPEYCTWLIDYCANGGTFEAFAGTYHLSPGHMGAWAKDYPEFNNVVMASVGIEHDYWTMQLQDALENPALAFRLPSINAKLSRLESILFKNTIRSSLYSTYENVPEQGKEELERANILKDFISK